MSNRILKDLELINYKLRHEKSKNLITYYFAAFVALTSLLELREERTTIKYDFDIKKVLDIFNERVRKDKKRYLGVLSDSIEPNFIIASRTLEQFESTSFNPYRERISPFLDENKSSDYLIDFMKSMGPDVFDIFRKMYFEDRVSCFKNGEMNGLCTSAGILDSHYITYAPRCDYFDASIVSHEIGHVIGGHLNSQRGNFGLVGSIFDETISQYMELAYLDHVKMIDNNTKEVETSTLRTHFKNTLDILMTYSFAPLGLLYTNGVDIRSMIDRPEGVEEFLDEKYLKIYEETMKEYSYAKSATYFIGFTIASYFLDMYKDDPIKGLWELKNFITISSIGTYDEVLGRLNLQENDMSFIKRRIERISR